MIVQFQKAITCAQKKIKKNQKFCKILLYIIFHMKFLKINLHRFFLFITIPKHPTSKNKIGILYSRHFL